MASTASRALQLDQGKGSGSILAASLQGSLASASRTFFLLMPLRTRRRLADR